MADKETREEEQLVNPAEWQQQQRDSIREQALDLTLKQRSQIRFRKLPLIVRLR